jgi:hypothetical protein
LAGETKVLGENLSQCRFVHHKADMLPGREPGRRGGKPATNRLSYGTAVMFTIHNTELDLWDIRIMNADLCTEIYTPNSNANVTSDSMQDPLQQSINNNEALILDLQ